MNLTANDVIDIIEKVENIKDYDERLKTISNILFNFYNSKYQPDGININKNNTDEKMCY